MWCEAVYTEEKYQSTAPEIGVSTKIPLQFMLLHSDEADASVEQVARRRCCQIICFLVVITPTVN